LAAALSTERTALYAHSERLVDHTAWQHYREMLDARLAGRPIAHLTGQREFWSLSLRVNEFTLIPRPETEHLVEAALIHSPPETALLIADLGTGSGAIACALARERPHARIVATDVCTHALAMASENARALGLDNIEFRQGDWFAALQPLCCDLIVSNPPYIRADDPCLTNAPLSFEPYQALCGGADGLDDIRTLVSGAHRHLKPGGRLLLEHGADQGAAIRELLTQHGFTEITTLKDLSGHDRVTEGSHKI
jgi:release factor glutamine methyltransferase